MGPFNPVVKNIGRNIQKIYGRTIKKMTDFGGHKAKRKRSEEFYCHKCTESYCLQAEIDKKDAELANLRKEINEYRQELKYLEEVEIDNSTLAFYDRESPIHKDNISTDTKMDDYVKLLPLSVYFGIRNLIESLKLEEWKTSHAMSALLDNLEKQLAKAKKEIEGINNDRI